MTSKGDPQGNGVTPEVVALRSIVRHILDGELPVEDRRKGWWWWGTDEDGMPSARLGSLTTDEADALARMEPNGRTGP